MKTSLTIGVRTSSIDTADVSSASGPLPVAARSIGTRHPSIALLLTIFLLYGDSRADVVQLAESVRTTQWTGPSAAESIAGIRFRPQADNLTQESLPPVGAQHPAVNLAADGLKPIGQLTIDTQPQPGEMPENVAAAKFAQAGHIPHPLGTNRPWNLYSFWWESPALCHQPLYFEEVNLERYGYSYGIAQPAVSAAHFFGRIPALPYLMTANPPRECVYTLGHYLPGSCAPYHVYYPPFSLKGGVVQAGVVTGLIFVLP
jgi:hypothetical protein